MTTSASSASAIGAARMPTQGSCRPLVLTSALWPCTSIDSRGDRMELVGLMPMLTSRSWPVLMPPTMPPAWLLRKPSGLSESPCVVPRWATLPKPAPISTALTAFSPIMA